jgi:hypothetical protein
MQTARSEQLEQRVAGPRGAASRMLRCKGHTGSGVGGTVREVSQAGAAYMIVSGSERGAGALFHRRRRFALAFM